MCPHGLQAKGMHVAVSPHSPSGEDVMDVAAGSKPPWKTANAAAASRMAGGGGTRPGCGVMTGDGRASISSQGAGWAPEREEQQPAMKEKKVRSSSSEVTEGGEKGDVIRGWKRRSV